MAIKHLVTHTEGDPGETGAANLGKIFGLGLVVVTLAINLSYFGIIMPPMPTPLTFTQWWMGTFIMMVLSLGAYRGGMGKGLFAKLSDALVDRIRGGKG